MSLGAHVVVIKDGEVLLIQREDFKIWVLPGGHAEAGESAAQAAVRVWHRQPIRDALADIGGSVAWQQDVH